MNARCDSFDIVNYVVNTCNISECNKSHYEKCNYCWLYLESGVIIDRYYHYNMYYSEGE